MFLTYSHLGGFISATNLFFRNVARTFSCISNRRAHSRSPASKQTLESKQTSPCPPSSDLPPAAPRDASKSITQKRVDAAPTWFLERIREPLRFHLDELPFVGATLLQPRVRGPIASRKLRSFVRCLRVRRPVQRASGRHLSSASGVPAWDRVSAPSCRGRGHADWRQEPIYWNA